MPKMTGTLCKHKACQPAPTPQFNAQYFFSIKILPFSFYGVDTTTPKETFTISRMTHPEKYPDTWPKANPHRRKTLASRITEAEKMALYNREITARELADRYNTHEKYIAAMYPGRVATVKPPKKSDSPLVKARTEFRLDICIKILEGEYTVRKASVICNCSYNTMQRWLAKAKEMRPDLVPEYNKRLSLYRGNLQG